MHHSHGDISVEQFNIIKKIFVKVHNWGLTKTLHSADDLFETLLKSTCCPNHRLHQ